MYEEWQWFCGTNNSDLSVDLSAEWIGNTCFINGLAVLPHLAFIIFSALALFLLGFCCKYRDLPKTNYLLCYPGHSVKWLVGILSLAVLAAAIGEGVLTDETYRVWQYSTRPHYYVPSAAAFVAMLMSLVYYHHMEKWQLPVMSVPLLCYWILALVGEVLRLVNLGQHNIIDFTVLRFDVTVLMVIAYFILLLNAMNLIRIKVFRPSNRKKVFEDLQNSNMRFLNDYVNIVSNATFWWMNWIFIKGYKKPLEQDDLGDIPERHRADFNHRKFKAAFDREKARADKKGTRPSMLRIYFDAYGSVMLATALLKVTADVLNLVGPLCIGALTSYVVTLSYPVDSELLPPHYVTFGDFFANGFVLIVTMFVVLSMRVCIFNAHFKLAFTLSADVRAAIQR
ncbi:ATP-binding cassette sub-family C member 8-like [Acanthaster planci]|uniref:ATP-binding cassette sub-family C member 8-like n=1 Tax=Acanthaster planci TaxID=133434 RepID=A0A8B7ZBZ0_ACAPL|nr:ATP-binding cassette sub-family C member 8-like [Acanthaster planci]